MPSKPVQISLDVDLLARIDADAETQARGRSAFMRSAVEGYLDAKRRRGLDTQIAAAYRRRADAMLDEVRDIMDVQAWPED